MNIIEYPDRELLAMDVADKLASDLENRLVQGDSASFAVPGGTTPGPIFDVLSSIRRLDWSRVTVMLTDERWVPEDHARSNTALVRARLLTDAAQMARFLPFYGEGAIGKTVPRLGEDVSPVLPISVLLLGMGDDMHTASLFPGAPGVHAALAPDAPVLNIVEPEDQPEQRVTLAAHVLNGALSKHLVIFGAAKREALERAQKLPPEQAPIRAVMQDLTVHWAE
ncbi:6-phosphogluconolactonase [Aliishimia ponticola]|uniref:6-phosphogluconolactonase n=1 Tax=Aliishimia ponticola TaxID=2499833 RepID=A0A4S4NG80_9RHOB|nr:6-phosphogluconolactonase [Aliishimia ponticola]THH38599.1 6-phosphogluconolactonase [Aliishimia ponticola]